MILETALVIFLPPAAELKFFENESSEIKAVRRQQSLKLAMAGVAYAKKAANFRRARM
jgi:hypothetical protein